MKGFDKVFLEPGETRTVEIDVPVSELAFYDETQRKFVVEPGEFQFHIAASAGDIKNTVSIQVQ
ncbi:MAG: fibronectin type III-like domain-contianing protein [Tannerellaceae bacterium]|nr:fibronectin type III-like domain-contianing protein [Tannerellaceae bacterium]